MLIKERSALWSGRPPSEQAVWNLTAAWPNGASNAFGETWHEAQEWELMSLVDLSGSEDEWGAMEEKCCRGSRRSNYTWGEETDSLLNFMVNEVGGKLLESCVPKDIVQSASGVSHFKQDQHEAHNKKPIYTVHEREIHMEDKKMWLHRLTDCVLLTGPESASQWLDKKMFYSFAIIGGGRLTFAHRSHVIGRSTVNRKASLSEIKASSISWVWDRSAVKMSQILFFEEKTADFQISRLHLQRHNRADSTLNNMEHPMLSAFEWASESMGSESCRTKMLLCLCLYFPRQDKMETKECLL